MNIPNKFLCHFEHIYIINLPERTDRKYEIIEQFKSIGIEISVHPQIEFFSATRPTDKGEFDSIGTKGCFLSHLNVLKDAKLQNYNRILILEDDNNFIKEFTIHAEPVLAALNTANWQIFYGNYRSKKSIELNKATKITHIKSTDYVELANFIAFQDNIIIELIDFFEQILLRKNGDPDGGPMHVDGAYHWFHSKYVECNTYISNIKLGYQRKSRSDIVQLKWYDKFIMTRNLSAFYRKTFNKFK